MFRLDHRMEVMTSTLASSSPHVTFLQVIDASSIHPVPAELLNMCDYYHHTSLSPLHKYPLPYPPPFTRVVRTRANFPFKVQRSSRQKHRRLSRFLRIHPYASLINLYSLEDTVRVHIVKLKEDIGGLKCRRKLFNAVWII